MLVEVRAGTVVGDFTQRGARWGVDWEQPYTLNVPELLPMVLSGPVLPAESCFRR